MKYRTITTTKTIIAQIDIFFRNTLNFEFDEIKPGSTNIKSTLKSILNQASDKILANKKDFRMVIIEGHTDSDKIPKKLQKFYPTNWELSAARASNVVNYLISRGVNSGRLQASGYAVRWPSEASWFDVRSGKITDETIAKYNLTEKQKRKNRRIKIVFTNN